MIYFIFYAIIALCSYPIIVKGVLWIRGKDCWELGDTYAAIVVGFLWPWGLIYGALFLIGYLFIKPIQKLTDWTRKWAIK